MRKISKLFISFFLFLLPLLLWQLNFAQAKFTAPVINVWYGTEQTFGHNGVPQEWINILGTVSALESVASLTYSLNGGPPQPLSIGPDIYRLDGEGDFNIEIAYDDLDPLPAHNEIIITAIDQTDNVSTETVTVTYQSGINWPLPYSIDWSGVAEITDAVQIVDGQWQKVANGIRPVSEEALGYDRLVTFGDRNSWYDYEVVVPITIHGLDPNTPPSGAPSGSPGVGMMVRWQGHDEKLAVLQKIRNVTLSMSALGTQQPRIGFSRHGALAWYRFWSKDTANGNLRLQGNIDDSTLVENSPNKRLSFGETYYFKTRSVSVERADPVYSFKVWNVNDPEPPIWDIIGHGDADSTANGSVLLIAHHADVTFGDAEVTPYTNSKINVNIIETGSGSVEIVPDPSEYPEGYSYGTAITITAAADAGWFFGGWGGGLSDHPNPASVILTDDIVATALFVKDNSGIQSDDFSGCGLNETIWTLIDPLDDATWTTNGEQVGISVPAGTEHNVWLAGNDAPRIMQATADENFQIEVKYDSGFDKPIPIQGIIVEQDRENFLRFDFYQKSITETRVFAAAFTPGVGNPLQAKVHANSNLSAPSVPMYMRITRSNNQWTQAYSFDGEQWTNSAIFTHALQVTSVGAFVGNAGDNLPAHTALVDYFFNSAFPIDPEDGTQFTYSVTANVSGAGTVEKKPLENGGYLCGEEVTLTAVADTGWNFADWSGDVTGSQNPVAVTVMGDMVVSANFIENGNALIVNTVGNGTVTKQPDQAFYSSGQQITLTAESDAGWSFGGWSGGLNGDQPTRTITITQDMTITATFIESKFKLFLPLIERGSTQLVKPFYEQ